MYNRYQGTYPAKPWGICQKSGKQVLLEDMVYDGFYPDMLVCEEWYDPPDRHASLEPKQDQIVIDNPAPDVDNVGVTLNFPFYNVETGAKNNGFALHVELGQLTVTVS